MVEAFRKEGYNVVATSLKVSQALTASPNLVLVDGDIGMQETAGVARAGKSPERCCTWMAVLTPVVGGDLGMTALTGASRKRG